MCMNCGDFVDYCDAEGCYNPNGGRYGTLAKFYIGDRYCEHLAARYGHEVAMGADSYLENDPAAP